MDKIFDGSEYWMMTMDEIIPNLYVGELLDANFVAYRISLGEDDWEVITVTDYEPDRSIVGNSTHICITRKISKDHEGIRANMKSLNKAADKIDEILKKKKKCLIHCGGGIERSPLCVAWYLHKKKGMTIADAYQLLWQKRPCVLYRGDWLGKYEG
jgi:hypothetical protein